MSSISSRAKITLNSLAALKAKGERFACVTAYDATFAEIASSTGIEVLLVGDSLGMVIQGHDSTLPVTMEDILYHLDAVRRGNLGSLIMGDMPFMSYYSEGLTLENAAQLMRAGAHVVKLEGGRWIAESTRLLVERGIPVIGIGAGKHVDSQILVMQDLLGITLPGIKVPKFVKNFLAESPDGIRGAFAAYLRAVKDGSFPGPEHSY
jgi:ketopantoate hydroxymethyltransferase